MSGFALILGQPEPKELETMFEKIKHRGPDLGGLVQTPGAILAQNYLPPDGPEGKTGTELPLAAAANPELRVCYDGQMGNWADLAQKHDLSDGPFREERLLLALYQKYGPEMLTRLNDAIYALALFDGQNLLAARDPLGLKTLFYGRKGSCLYLASELKSLTAVTDEVYEFPPGHYMDQTGRLTKFADLPQEPPAQMHQDVDQMIEDIRALIRKSLRNRIDFRFPTGGLLSGGIDSSVINYLAAELLREKVGPQARLKTFALGVGESEDIHNARLVSEMINSEHHELLVDLEEILEVLPQVIYYLESFDPSLVRSSASNFLVSRYAHQQGIQVLLSGEGGDEVFCGYLYLKQFPPQELFARQIECLGFLHSNASLRLDRMNQCNQVRVVAPLASGELLNYALAIPPEYKQKPESDEVVEKWIFRKAFEPFLPEPVVWRLKQEFSQGSGSAGVLPAYFEEAISDEELAEAQARHQVVRSKEELYYFRLFTEYFGSGRAVETVGQWVSL